MDDELEKAKAAFLEADRAVQHSKKLRDIADKAELNAAHWYASSLNAFDAARATLMALLKQNATSS